MNPVWKASRFVTKRERYESRIQSGAFVSYLMKISLKVLNVSQTKCTTSYLKSLENCIETPIYKFNVCVKTPLIKLSIFNPLVELLHKLNVNLYFTSHSLYIFLNIMTEQRFISFGSHALQDPKRYGEKLWNGSRPTRRLPEVPFQQPTLSVRQ